MARPPGKRHAGRSNGRHQHQSRAAAPESEALHRAAAHCHGAFAYWTTDGKALHELEDLLCLIDCAELCIATAGFVARDAHYAGELRNLCSQQLRDVQDVLADYPKDAVLGACASALRDADDALQVSLMAFE